MKTAIALLLFLALPMFGAGSAERDVLAAVDAWKDAALKGDAISLGKIYHDDLGVYPLQRHDAEQSRGHASETSLTGVYKGIIMREVTVHVYGNTAILEYKLDLTHFAGDTAHLHEIMVWLSLPKAGSY